MPLLIDTESRTGTLVRAVNDTLVEHGPGGLTLRRLARASGVSTSSILHHLGSREHLLRVAAHRTGLQRLQTLRAESSLDGALAFVPRSDDEVLDARAWLGWLELWRSEEFLERVIADARRAEFWLLAAVLDHRLARPELDAAAALVDGLLTAVCSPRDPMRLEVARGIFASHLGIECRPVPMPAFRSAWPA
jgi:AcrR family transcriptional regulator